MQSNAGPCPDWDPEVVEALDNAEICVETDSQLEDDFVMLVSYLDPQHSAQVTHCLCLLLLSQG